MPTICVAASAIDAGTAEEAGEVIGAWLRASGKLVVGRVSRSDAAPEGGDAMERRPSLEDLS